MSRFATRKRRRADLATCRSRSKPVCTDDSPSLVFDRAWARAIVQHAAALYMEHAESEGGAAHRRATILAMRAGEGLPIRKIAARLDVEADQAHRDYAAARRAYQEQLREVVRATLGVEAVRVDDELHQLQEILRS